MKKISILILLTVILLTFSACGDEMVLDSASDLAALRVGAVSSTAGETYAANCGSEAVSVFATIEEAVEALVAGEIDCIITDLNTAKDVASNRDDVTNTKTRIIQDTDWCAAVRSADFDSLAVAEVVSAEVHKETNFSKLCRGFIENTGEDRDAFITADQVGSSGTFTLGTTADYPPYAYLTEDGKAAGISVEYAKRYAQKRDQTLEIKIYEDDSELSKALKSGEIDMYFEQLPVPAVPGITYSTTCYTVELRVLIADN